MNNKCPNCGCLVDEDGHCPSCGNVLIKTKENTDEKIKYPIEKLDIDKGRIILLDLNYTLISNSNDIKNMPLDEKIRFQEYEMDLINLIKDNYVILITASPYKRSHMILRDIKEKTGFVPNESYWNFHRKAPDLKKYWMVNEVLPMHGDDSKQYLAIESNPTTRGMYEELGIEAKSKHYFI